MGLGVIIFMREIRNSSVMTRLVLMKFWVLASPRKEGFVRAGEVN